MSKINDYFEYVTDIVKVVTGTDDEFIHRTAAEYYSNMMSKIITYIKNGFYIPFVYMGLLWLTQNFFLSTIIAVKLYPANHWYWFSEAYSYDNIPKQYNWVKQFMRFTDTGHIVSFLYLLDSAYLPLAHNVHFFITLGYWAGKALGSEDQDQLLEKPNSGIIRWHETFWSSVCHGIPYLLFLREMILSEQCFVFDWHILWSSYLWNYIWLFVIYIPWRVYTGDIIYSILDFSNGYEKPAKFIVFLHFVTLFSNITGYLLSLLLC